MPDKHETPPKPSTGVPARVPPNSGTLIQRDEFGAAQTQLIRETASTAVAAREKAAVEARYVMALQRPRSVERARQELLAACKHAEFAEEAWYSRPAGRRFNRQTQKWEDSNAEGFSIRFAEEAIQCFGNIYPEMSVVFESDDTRIIRSTVTDMEKNVPYSTEIVIAKRIERKKLKEGQEAIGERVNSDGEKIFIVEATDDEVLQRVNNLRSKSIRTDGLRLIPAWVKAECKAQIFATMRGQLDKDFQAEKRKVFDAFGKLGITVAHLEDYFGKPVETLTLDEVLTLRPLLTGLKENEITWEQAMDNAPARNLEGTKQAANNVRDEKLRQAAAESGKPSSEPDKTQPESEPEPKPAANRGFFGEGRK